jgi:predicted DNA-binding transcriptional regulator YafY
MKRLTRLTSILLQLQSNRSITSKDLAEKFNVSQRTIYRDVKDLQEAEVPIIGEAGSGYSLMEHYRLPPMMFTDREINSLLTAKKLLETNSDKSVARDLDNLVNKIKAVLRHTLRQKSETVEQRIIIFKNENTQTDLLSKIESAIADSIVLRIKYNSHHSDSIAERNVEPLAVYYTKQKWVMIAHCLLRNDVREFRLDRILYLAETSTRFRAPGFSFDEYMVHHQ